MMMQILLHAFLLCLLHVRGQWFTKSLMPQEPLTYSDNEEVLLEANKLTSEETPVEFDYYDLPFCRRKKKDGMIKTGNLGERLRGDSTTVTPYDINMNQKDFCKVLCRKLYDKDDLKLFRKVIRLKYKVHWILDNLPVLVRTSNDHEHNSEEIIEKGYPVGFMFRRHGAGGNTMMSYYLYNHVRLVIKINQMTADGSFATEVDPRASVIDHSVLDTTPVTLPEEYNKYKIVGFELIPFSMKHEYSVSSDEYDKKTTELSTCNKLNLAGHSINPDRWQSVNGPENDSGQEEVIFTYDVRFEKSYTPWTNRWEIYIRGNDAHDTTHYFSIINSLVVVLLLTTAVAMIMVRTLHKDISSYNREQFLKNQQVHNPLSKGKKGTALVVDKKVLIPSTNHHNKPRDQSGSGSDDFTFTHSLEEGGQTIVPIDAFEEWGWKLVHADVFRPPAWQPILLSTLVGTGAQIIGMVCVTLTATIFGLHHPDQRGVLLSSGLLLFTVCGIIGGYTAAQVYRVLGGKSYITNTLYTALLYPGLMGIIFLTINVSIAGHGSSAATPVTTMLALILLWFGVNTPLTFLGAYLGYRSQEIEIPTSIAKEYRPIPRQSWYLHPSLSILLGGILPFGAVSIEVFFMMSALWRHEDYHVFDFLPMVFFILIVTCAEICIVLCYFNLCAENHEWQWRSFLTSGSTALYLFIFSIWYYQYNSEIQGILPTLMYFMYMTMATLTFFVMTGSIGYLACLWFLKKIYGSIKID